MKIFAGLLAVLLLAVLGFAVYMGAFTPVVLKEESRGPYHFVYRTADSASPALVGRLTTEIAGHLDSFGVSERNPLDVYYPDGSAEIGFAVGGVELRNLAFSDGTRVRTVPEQQMMVAKFPWRNPLSFLVGYMKVDPLLEAHRESHGYVKTEAMTIYESGMITYLQPVRVE